jgi:hypothetical protein
MALSLPAITRRDFGSPRLRAARGALHDLSDGCNLEDAFGSELCDRAWTGDRSCGCFLRLRWMCRARYLLGRLRSASIVKLMRQGPRSAQHLGRTCSCRGNRRFSVGPSRAESAARWSVARCAASGFAAPDAGSALTAGDGSWPALSRVPTYEKPESLGARRLVCAFR